MPQITYITHLTTDMALRLVQVLVAWGAAMKALVLMVDAIVSIFDNL